MLEEVVQGEEASFHVLVDGETVLPRAAKIISASMTRIAVQTWWMGAYPPAPVITGSSAHYG